MNAAPYTRDTVKVIRSLARDGHEPETVRADLGWSAAFFHRVCGTHEIEFPRHQPEPLKPISAVKTAPKPRVKPTLFPPGRRQDGQSQLITTVTADMHDKFARLAAEHGLTRGGLLRKLIVDYVKRNAS